MNIDLRVLAQVNLVVQTLLVLAILAAAYLARKKQLVRHCTIMRVAVVVQIATVGLVMLPALISQLKAPLTGFTIEMLVHHTLGSAVIVIWVYVNLAMLGIIKVRRLVLPMRLAFGLWLIAYVLGVRAYVLVWL
ncbi:MAG: hypothetical protein HYX91_01100 [Chloroflexi bacterium]|nr:hypothetical protein [Chloroflexota bacterium]